MAVTNEQVLAAIAEYREANTRPCPARYITDKFGSDALPIIAALKESGAIVGRRGRTGGLVPADATTAANVSSTVTDDSVSDQFAALAAKLAADDVSADAANG